MSDKFEGLGFGNILALVNALRLYGPAIIEIMKKISEVFKEEPQLYAKVDKDCCLDEVTNHLLKALMHLSHMSCCDEPCEPCEPCDKG